VSSGLGSMIDLLPDAALGVVGLQDKADSTARSLKGMTDEIGNTMGGTSMVAVVGAAFDGPVAGADRLSTAAREAGSTVDQLKQEALEASGALGGLARSGEDAAENIDIADAAWGRFLGTLGVGTEDALANAQRSLFDLQDALKEIDKNADLQKIIGKTGRIDTTTREGLAVRDAFSEQRDALVKLSEAYAEGSVDAAGFIAAAGTIRQGVEDQATSMKLGKEAVKGLVSEFGTLPPDLQVGLGFEFDEQGFATIRSAINVFDGQTFEGRIAFDVNDDGVVTGTELGTQFEGKVWDAKLGYVIDEAMYQDALSKGEQWAVKEWFARLSFSVDNNGLNTAVREAAATTSAVSRSVRPTRAVPSAHGRVLRSPEWLPYIDRSGTMIPFGGEAGVEILSPVNDMPRTVALFREAGALGRLVDQLITAGVVAPPSAPTRYMTDVAAPVVAPVINVHPPAGMNQLAFAREAYRQVRAGAAAATAEAMRAGRPRGGMRR